MSYAGEVTSSVVYGHRLHGYNGRCARIHGHNAVVTVRVEAQELDAQGFVVDFYEVKRALDDELARLDHRLLLGPCDPLAETLRAAGEPFVELGEAPTAECLARLLCGLLNTDARPWRVAWVRWEEEPGFSAEARR